MRINLIGNVLNLAFIVGSFLRNKGYEARVFIDKKAPEIYMPQWESPELKDKLPQWVEAVDIDLKRLSVFGAKEMDFIRRIRDCDLIHAFGEATVWARFTGRPYIFSSYGGDLDILPFRKTHLKGILYAYVLRNALKKASLVLYAMPPQKKSIERLKLVNNRFFSHAIPIDTDKYRPFSEDEKRRLKAQYGTRFIFFQPTRQEWTCKDTNNKGNDILFKAFARFVKNKNKEAILIAVESGRDVEKSRCLIKQLGITENVKWVKPMVKNELIELLNTADVCFDQFVYGSYGFAALEALSIGVPTFLYLSREFAGCDSPPVINVKSEDQIYEKMAELAADRNRLIQIGKDSREWVLKHHQWEKVIADYIDLYKEVLKK